MFVQKMPMAAGYEGFPFIPSFQADKEQAEAVLAVRARAEMELAVIKAKAEEASLIVKARCGSKRKAEEDGGEVTVKAKSEEEDTVKAKVEEAAAFTTVKAKSEEEDTVKAKEEEAAAFTTVKAKSEEEDTVKAKAEEEVEDSDEDAEWDEEEFMARMEADHAAHIKKLQAMYPTVKYGDYDPEVYCHRPDPESDAWNLLKKAQGLAEIAAGLL